jgi:hypothetical protein
MTAIVAVLGVAGNTEAVKVNDPGVVAVNVVDTPFDGLTDPPPFTLQFTAWPLIGLPNWSFTVAVKTWVFWVTTVAEDGAIVIVFGVWPGEKVADSLLVPGPTPL